MTARRAALAAALLVTACNSPIATENVDTASSSVVVPPGCDMLSPERAAYLLPDCPCAYQSSVLHCSRWAQPQCVQHPTEPGYYCCGDPPPCLTCSGAMHASGTVCGSSLGAWNGLNSCAVDNCATDCAGWVAGGPIHAACAVCLASSCSSEWDDCSGDL